MLTCDGRALTFAEWGYLGKGKFQRRDFRLEFLTQSSTFSREEMPWADLGSHVLFKPVKTYAQMTVSELASAMLPTATKEPV
jgi:hypothetical protein